MKKVISIIFAVIMILNLVACSSGGLENSTNSSEEWLTIAISDVEYNISMGENAEYSVVADSDTGNLCHFYKGEEKLFALVCMNGSLSDVQSSMEEGSELMERRQDDNAIYKLYKNNDTTVDTKYFLIVDMKNKDGFFSCETTEEMDTLKPIYDVLKIK